MTKILKASAAACSSLLAFYVESALDSTLQSGQLDASSAFITQPIELHPDYILLLPAINLGMPPGFSAAKQDGDRHRKLAKGISTTTATAR